MIVGPRSSPTREQIPDSLDHAKSPLFTRLDHALRLGNTCRRRRRRRPLFCDHLPPLLDLGLHSFVLLVSGLQLAQPSIALLLGLLLLLQGIVLLALLAILLPVHTAGGHGDDGEALGVDAAAEHAVGGLVVAGLHGAAGAQEGPAGQQTAERDEGFLAEAAGELLPAVFGVEVPGCRESVNWPAEKDGG